jgi:transcriptional regulator with XRE-family HTH domain
MNQAKKLGAELRKARVASQLKLRQVEARTGISNGYLSQLENGQVNNPSPQFLEKLAEVYGINYETVLTNAGYLKRPGSSNRDVFLSHRSADKDMVRELAADIEAETFGDRPLTVWLDEAEIRPGQSIPGLVNSGLETSRFVALVMTPAYFETKSGWTDAEWHAALHNDPDNRRGRILPLLLQDCPYVPYLLRHLRAIDLRAQRYSEGLKELLAVLKDEPLPRPVTHRGQLIVSGTRLDRSTLIAERAVPDADPDVITERLYCNLLPLERLPRYIYMSPITPKLVKTRKNDEQVLPSKNRLKETIRAAQEAEGLSPDRRFMPAFRLFEDKVITFHDLEDSNSPLAAITTENAVEVFDTATFTRDDDLRNILLSLLNMALSRHLFRAGLVVDETKPSRFFFPTNNGSANVITWIPRRKRATRTVAKPVTRDDRIIYWRHLGAYVTTMFLVNKFYVKLSPTWVITSDGIHPSGGPTIAKRVNKWTGPERNLQVLYHVRFWTSVLRGRKGGPINVWAGDQLLEIAAVPAGIEVPYGIGDDQRDLMRLLDEEAPVLAVEEDELADIALEGELDDDEADLDADEEPADNEVVEE